MTFVISQYPGNETGALKLEYNPRVSVPIITTKLFIPPPYSQVIARARLLDQLSAGFSKKLTLISAPAGFGKTTLLSECARQCDRPIAWYSLDQGDNERIRFLSYFISALNVVSEGFGDGILQALFASQPPGKEILLSGLINEISEIQKPFVIVLDDYHVITNPEIHEILTFIVENQPPAMHMVLSSRADPPWPLARWRARREMNEIRTQDLRFTPEEAAILLNAIMGVELPMDEVIRLEAKTEGWVSGLLMAAISMRDMRDVSGFIKTFEGSHRFIFDYLVEEVLDGLPAQIQEFLLQTSILERLCAPLCDAILDRCDSQTVIQQLEGMNLFIFPLDDRRYWYRYHQLFSDLLVNRFTELSPESVTDLHRRASGWYEANDFLSEAVAHAFSAGDIKRVAHIAQANVLGIMDRGELGMLIQWLDELPGEVIDESPWLRVAQAWVLSQAGSFEAADQCLTAVQAALQPDSNISKDQKAHISGHIAAIRFYIDFIYLDDYSRAAEHAHDALELLPQTDLRTRGMVTVLLGNMQRIQQELNLALDTLSSALEINRISGQAYVVIDILSQMARVRRDQGLLHETAHLCQQAQDVADQFARGGQHRLPIVAYAMGTLGRIYYEWNQLDSALEIGSQALKLSERWGQVNTLMGNLLFVTRIYRVRGEFEQALAAIQAAKDIAGGFSDSRAAVIGTHEMLIRLAMGDIHPVEQWVKCDSASFETDQDELLLEMAPLILALYRVGKVDDLDDLLAVLDRMSVIFGDKGIHRRFATVNVQKAVVYQALEKYDQAVAALKSSLDITRPEGYVRVYLDHGAPMEDLLKKAITAGIQVDYASRLLSTLQLELYGGKLHQGDPPVPLVEPLTNRENEVLRLLVTELTIPEIADELVITPGTLRTHIKRIYAKLNAHSRFEALTKARKSGLL